MKGFPDLPPVWLLGCMAVAWILARGLPLVTLSGPVLTVVGWLLTIVGLAAIVWSALWFRRKRTTIEPHHEPSTLIIEGPYRFSRNPIYLGMLAILSGFVLILGALSAVLLVPVFLAIVTRRFVEPEEAALRAQFGADAQAYLRQTRRWL